MAVQCDLLVVVALVGEQLAVAQEGFPARLGHPVELWRRLGHVHLSIVQVRIEELEEVRAEQLTECAIELRFALRHPAPLDDRVVR